MCQISGARQRHRYMVGSTSNFKNTCSYGRLDKVPVARGLKRVPLCPSLFHVTGRAACFPKFKSWLFSWFRIRRLLDRHVQSTGTRSSSASSTPSRPRYRHERRSTPSSTITRPTNIPGCKNMARHPRWTLHFTPTSASWLNAVEGFFAKLARRRLKRGVFLSVVDLQAAINRFVAEHNVEPKPFTWTADPDKIIRAVRRGYQVLDSIQ